MCGCGRFLPGELDSSTGSSRRRDSGVVQSIHLSTRTPAHSLLVCRVIDPALCHGVTAMLTVISRSSSAQRTLCWSSPWPACCAAWPRKRRRRRRRKTPPKHRCAPIGRPRPIPPVPCRPAPGSWKPTSAATPATVSPARASKPRCSPIPRSSTASATASICSSTGRRSCRSRPPIAPPAHAAA